MNLKPKLPALASIALAALLFGGVVSSPTTANVPTAALQSADGSSAVAMSADEMPTTIVNHYPLDMAGLADKVAAEGALTVLATDGELLTLTLTEHDLFVPGEKKVIDVDAEGKQIETPYLGRTFAGTLAGDPASPASMLITAEGLYGTVQGAGQRWSFQRAMEQEANAPGTITQEVVLEVLSTEASSATDPAFSPLFGMDSTSAAVVSPVGDGGLPSVPDFPEMTHTPSQDHDHFYYLKPYADYKFATTYGDWSNRIVAAFNHGYSMWANELRTYTLLYSIQNAGTNFNQSNTNCSPDMGLDLFSSWTNSVAFSGPNVYVLFEAYANPGPGIGGCANPRWIDYHYSSTHYTKSTAVVVAKDFYDGSCCIFDTYDPDNTFHLGLAVHHEITHNAGEDGHPGDGSWCNNNLMKNGDTYNCSAMWRTSGTKQKVRDFGFYRFG